MRRKKPCLKLFPGRTAEAAGLQDVPDMQIICSSRGQTLGFVHRVELPVLVKLPPF
jgi:hypothetical protein